jgi:hypothetical protein
MILILLVCSLVATPDRRDCTVDRSLRHEAVGQVDGAAECQRAGTMILPQWAARIDPATQYPKIECVRLDLLEGRRTG